MVRASFDTLSSRPLDSFPLANPLNQHFLNLNRVIKYKEPGEKERRRILAIIERNDQIAGLLNGEEYQTILTQENILKGSCKVGVVLCIDGRAPIIHQFGRTLNAWEVAGSLIGLKNDGKNIDSVLFNEILQGFIRSMGDNNRDLLEIVTAHTSLTTDHKCGAIQAGIDAGTYVKDRPPVDIALKEADKRTVAIENTYNQLLANKKKDPLNQVALTALIDTDTMGLILNYGKNELSTTKLLNSGLNDAIENVVGEIVGEFSSMRDTFTNTDFFLDYSQRILEITKTLLTTDSLKFSKDDTKYKEYISHYIDQNYSKLTSDQKKALKFTIARTIAVQYLTGLSKLPEIGHPDHPFSEHEEKYMVIAPKGKGMGRFDIAEQAFVSSPSGIENSIKEIHIKLSLLDKNREHRESPDEPDILFVSDPVDKKDWEEKNQMTHSIRADNAELYKALVQDSKIGDRVKKGNLIIVPVLVDQETGEVLEILEHSTHL